MSATICRPSHHVPFLRLHSRSIKPADYHPYYQRCTMIAKRGAAAHTSTHVTAQTLPAVQNACTSQYCCRIKAKTGMRAAAIIQTQYDNTLCTIIHKLQSTELQLGYCPSVFMHRFIASYGSSTTCHVVVQPYNSKLGIRVTVSQYMRCYFPLNSCCN